MQPISFYQGVSVGSWVFVPDSIIRAPAGRASLAIAPDRRKDAWQTNPLPGGVRSLATTHDDPKGDRISWNRTVDCSQGWRRLDSRVMDDITRILEAAAAGDRQAAAELLPLVYEELRQLAAAR